MPIHVAVGALLLFYVVIIIVNSVSVSISNNE